MFPRIALTLLLALLLLLPQTAEAYLGLIRQGAESAEVANALDHYGDRVASGDFNGDGFADIAVAAPDENNDIGVGGKHGVVIVSYGSELGITHVGADVLSVGAPSDFNVYFGKGLAAGDFNGDGVDDLAVGIPGMDEVGNVDFGMVWVYAGMLNSGISLAPYIQLDQNDCGAANEDGDQFGYTVCAGDMTLDGYADLFVGSIGEDNDAGLVAFFRGSAAGVNAIGSGFAKQSGLGGIDDAGALFGYSLAVGNFLDDDYLDLAIGAPYGDAGSLFDMGKVYVVRGTQLGPVAGGVEIHTPLSLGVPFQLNRAFGWSLAAGSFLDENGKRPDLAIGEPLFYVGGVPTSGRVVVVDYDGAGDVVHVGPRILDQGVLGQQVNGNAAFGWSLAAGNMMTKDGVAGPDGMDDLAIGAPQDDVLVPQSAEAMYWDGVGSAYLVPGSHSNFATTKTKVIDAMERNDLWFGFDEKLGWSLCFGKFDGGWDNLAIGVPNKMYPAFIEPESDKLEAGLVYIMAPWRQPQGRPHRSSIVQDCANRILYAQRMGQRLTPASTTKALTALIAAEAIQDGDVNPAQLYTIPDWVANKVTGSQYGLFAGEQISFLDLLRTMIAVSGNDCSYAIGNILSGEDNDWDYNQSTEWNLEHVLADFADIMNARTAQLGMSPAHQFNNPAGRPYGDHWTTAADMAIFVDGAMDNELFREIVGTLNWPNVQRLLPMQALFPWLNIPGFVPFVDNVGNGFFSSIAAQDPRARGVKGGSNGVSMVTGLFSAEVLNGYAKATAFGIPPYGSLFSLGGELLSLVGTDCEPATVTPAIPTPPPYATGQTLDIPVDQDSGTTTTATIDPSDTDDLCVEILRAEQTTPTVCLYATIERRSEFDLAFGETRAFGSSQNNLKQIGLAIHNMSDTETAPLHVVVPSLSFDADVTIAPQGSWTLPVPSGSNVDAADYVLWRKTSGVSPLMVEEIYGYDFTLGEDRTTPPNWKTVLRRDGIFRSDMVRTTVLGCGPADGNTVHVTMHNVNGATPVEDGDVLPANRAALAGLTNYPNPFNPRTTIQFELNGPASVAVRIYDLAGRLLRVLETGRQLEKGVHNLSWDGSDNGGRGVASGVYLVQVDDGVAGLTRRVTLLK